MRLSALDLLLMIAVALIVTGVVGIARSEGGCSDAVGRNGNGLAPCEPDVPAWGKAYHTCGTFGATDDDCVPPKRGKLYAFCDTEWAEVCNQNVLMLRDVCEQTVEMYGGGDPRFSCAAVDDATRDAYLEMPEPDIREKTFQAWAAGR